LFWNESAILLRKRKYVAENCFRWKFFNNGSSSFWAMLLQLLAAAARQQEHENSIATLERLVGQLTIENSILSKVSTTSTSILSKNGRSL
jgi:hypothetical protein